MTARNVFLSLVALYTDRDLRPHAADADEDLAYLSRFTGLQAIWLGSDQPKTLKGTLFSNGVLSQPLGMPIRVIKDASLKGSQIPQI